MDTYIRFSTLNKDVYDCWFHWGLESIPKIMSAFKNLKKVKKIYKQHCFNIRKKMKKISIEDYLRSELENSTTHGLRYIVNKRLHYLEKFFWVINVLACIILVVILLNVQYSRFVAAPTVMSVEMNYFDWNISYPAITLCPLYKPDAIRFATFLNETNKKTGLKTNGYFWAISQAALDTLEYMDLTATEDVKKLAHPKNYATVAASLFRKFENGWLTTNTNWSVSVEAAMTEMGMCHVINSNVAIYDKPYDWSASVPAYRKKNIELSVFEADYFTEITNYANIYKVFIHSPDEVTMSSTSSFGFDVEGSISFGLSVWSTRISDELRHTSLRMRKCRFTNEPIGERYPIYSHNHCILECRIKMIQRLCGCVPHFYRTLGHERICLIEELQCVLKYRREIVTLAASNETLKNFNFHKDLPTISRDCGCLSTCELDLYYKDREDYTPEPGMNKLKIKITSFPKVRVVRDIIFNFNDVILRSGGVVNLCIGSSIISMMEFVLVTAKIIIYMLLRILQLFLI